MEYCDAFGRVLCNPGSKDRQVTIGSPIHLVKSV